MRHFARGGEFCGESRVRKGVSVFDEIAWRYLSRGVRHSDIGGDVL